MARLQKDFGLTREQAAGILGNLGHESAGFTAYGENGGRGPGVGWAQWTDPARKKNFLNFAKSSGLDPRSDEASYGFLKWELENTHRRALSNLRQQNTVDGATRAFEKDYEGAGIKHMDRRYGYARKAYGGDGASGAIAEAGAVSRAADKAAGLVGIGSSQAAQALGSKMTPGQWCADFVNGSLKAANVKGTNSAIANSFMSWGQQVSDSVKKGDVLVEHRGRGNGMPGGHVGLATGRSEIRNGRTFFEQISGNYSGRVGQSWVEASRVMARRAEETLAGKAGTFSIGDGMTSTGWKKASELAGQSPAEAMAKRAPMPMAGGGAGKGATIQAPITIQNNGDAEHTANQVQRRIQDSTNYRTHDIAFENI